MGWTHVAELLVVALAGDVFEPAVHVVEPAGRDWLVRRRGRAHVVLRLGLERVVVDIIVDAQLGQDVDCVLACQEVSTEADLHH